MKNDLDLKVIQGGKEDGDGPKQLSHEMQLFYELATKEVGRIMEKLKIASHGESYTYLVPAAANFAVEVFKSTFNNEELKKEPMIIALYDMLKQTQTLMSQLVKDHACIEQLFDKQQ